MFNPVQISKAKILPPPEGMELVHFGFEQVIADSLWLTYIQNNWDCSRYKDPDHTRCPERWGYKVLKSASNIDPRFLELHIHGPTKLTIIQDDNEGAEELFLAGLKHYPKNWVINYRLAYLYIEEFKDDERAATHLEIAANNGAPAWSKSLASRLYSKAGKKELSFTVLKELYDQTEEVEEKRKLEKRLMTLAAELRQISSTQK